MQASTEVRLSTLSYVIVYVKDANKALPFYRDVLGMKVKVDDGAWVEFDTGSVTLALHSSPEHSTQSKHPQGAVPVFEVPDIKAVYEKLKATGVHFEKELRVVCEEPNGRVGQSADFLDPDGNWISDYGFVNK